MSARPRPWLMPLLALATILFFGVGGVLLITEVQERSLQDVLVRGMGHRRQAVAGLGIGLLMATLAWAGSIFTFPASSPMEVGAPLKTWAIPSIPKPTKAPSSSASTGPPPISPPTGPACWIA